MKGKARNTIRSRESSRCLSKMVVVIVRHSRQCCPEILLHKHLRNLNKSLASGAHLAGQSNRDHKRHQTSNSFPPWVVLVHLAIGLITSPSDQLLFRYSYAASVCTRIMFSTSSIRTHSSILPTPSGVAP
jgi:hypothetical protein